MNSATNPIFRLNTKNPEAVLSIFDDTLELNKDLRCDLFSSISSSEIAFALFEKKQNKFLALEVFQKPKENGADWLEKIGSKSEIMKKNDFRTVQVAIVNELSTIVPAALFHDEDAKKYFQFNFKADDLLLKSEKIPGFDAVNVYGLPGAMNDSIHRLFSRPYLNHHSTVLLQAIHLSFKKYSEKSLFIHIRSGFVDVVVTEGKQLVFINSFQYKTVDDLVYYVMFVCDRLQLNPDSINSWLIGQVEEESAQFHLLYKYIRKIHFIQRPDFFKYSYVFDEIPGQYYFNLFNLALCES